MTRDTTGEHGTLLAMALVAAIEEDAQLGRGAVEQALRLVDGPIRSGHVTFGHDLTRAGFVYDLCHAYWSDAEHERFHHYLTQRHLRRQPQPRNIAAAQRLLQL